MTERTYLSEFEQLVLLAILRTGEEASGKEIKEDLEQTADRSRSIASIYAVLTRLERRGLVRSWMSDPSPVRGGRSKRCYAMEPEGVTALQEAWHLLERMWDGVDASLRPKSV